jgi:hypothetical protein
MGDSFNWGMLWSQPQTNGGDYSALWGRGRRRTNALFTGVNAHIEIVGAIRVIARDDRIVVVDSSADQIEA